MRALETDPVLRRFERDGIRACLALSGVGLLAVAPWRGAWAAASVSLGVLGGGLLAGFSYRAIKGAVDVVMHAAEAVGRPPDAGVEAGGRQPHQDLQAPSAEDPRSQQDLGPPRRTALPLGRRVFLAVKFFARYALLAVAAYVMLTCFRLHPVGVVAGATAPFLAALMQIGRMSRARGQQP